MRRDLGILRRTADVFLRSFAEGLRPRAGTTAAVRASTGFVGLEASEWWGSSQAALSVAIWSTTSNVRILDARYNVPLHLLLGPEPAWPTGPGFEPILLHYHYLTEVEYREQFPRTMRRIGCTPDACRWVAERLSLFA